MRYTAILFFVFFLLAFNGNAQTPLKRSFTGTVNISTSAIQSSGYRSTMVFNDQTNTYNGTDAAVGDVVIISTTAAVFRVDTIYSSNFSTLDVFLTELTSVGLLPIGRGQIERRTPNFALSLLTPDNALGISPQLLSILLTNNILKIDSLLNESSPQQNLSFDSNRPILREPTVGVNIGGSTVTDWLEWWYFTPPTLSLAQSPSTSVYEVGTSTAITLTSTTTNDGGATLSNGQIRVGAAQVSGFFGNTTGTFYYTYTPQQSNTGNYNQSSYTFTAQQDWVFGSDSGTATSNARTVRAVYPVLYGMVADTATAFADPYSKLTKLVQTEGDKTVSLTGNGLIIYGFPQTWSDTNLSSIIDPNGFDVTASFTRVDYPVVTSTGLVNNYTSVPYVFYFLNTGATSTSSSNYTFNR